MTDALALRDPIRNSYVETSSGQLHIRTCGTGDPVIVLQILPFSTFMLDGLLREMARAGYRAYAMDLMGYGRSDPRHEIWSVENFAANLGEALDSLQLRPLGIVAGHFTGMVAVELALTRPDLAHRLVLDGVPLWSRSIAAERLKSRAARPEPKDDGGTLLEIWKNALALLRRFYPALSLSPENQASIFRACSHFVEISLGPDATSAIMGYDLEAALRRLRAPTLIVGSLTDTLRDRHEQAVALLPEAWTHVFDDVHPLYRIDQPELAVDYVRVVDPFLRDGEAAS